MPCPHTTRDTVPHLVTSIRVYQEYLTQSDAHDQGEEGGIMFTELERPSSPKYGTQPKTSM
jgi:hypothetical protein